MIITMYKLNDGTFIIGKESTAKGKVSITDCLQINMSPNENPETPGIVVGYQNIMHPFATSRSGQNIKNEAIICSCTCPPELVDSYIQVITQGA
jgi:hypothetical protein